MDVTRFALRLLEPIPMLTGVPQLSEDRLLIRIGHPAPLMFIRTLPPHFAGLTVALELGRVEVLDASPADVSAALEAAAWGAVGSRAPAPRRLALVR